MKRWGERAMQASMGLCGVIVVCTAIGLCTGEAFLLRFPAVFAWLAAGLMLSAVLGPAGDAVGPALLTVLLNALFSFAAVCSTGPFRVRLLLPLLIGLALSVALPFRCRAGGFLAVLRWIELLLSGCCAVLFGLALLLLTFFPIAQRTAVCTADSPDGRYTAVVWDVDEGALGGSTVVEVADHTGGLDVGFGTFGRAPERVHLGSWGEWTDGPFEWEDEDTLLFNDLRFDMDA